MHGRVGGACVAVLALLALCGCNDAEPQPAEAATAGVSAARKFDPQRAGSIRGQVVWEGGLPKVPTIRGNVPTVLYEHVHVVKENPNAPVVDPASGGLGNAVVWLRNVDPATSRPWDHGPVRIEQRDLGIHIRQGERTSQIGFVKAGDAVEVFSRDKYFHALRARGAAAFTLPFVDADRPTLRKLERTGLVELSSGAGYAWMHAYLFVVDHPYLARTDASGEFVLHAVPPGAYQLVCWLPNWRIIRQDRDHESGHAERLVFAAPVEVVRPVEVAAGATVPAHFTISADMVGK